MQRETEVALFIVDLSSSEAMSECDSQREEAVQHVEDMNPEMNCGGCIRLSPREHHQASSHDHDFEVNVL